MKRRLHSLRRYFFVTIFIIASVLGWGQTTLYSTDFGTTSGTFPTGWTSSNTTNGFAAVTTSASTGYTGVSGSVNARFENTGTNGTVHTLTYSNTLSTVGYTSITVLWGARATSAFSQPVTFAWSSDGTTWNNVTYTNVTSSGNWALVNGGTRITLPSGAEGVSNLRFRFSITANSNGNYQIDDFSVQGGFYSVTSGDWSTGSTWNTGTVPTASDNVTITSGHIVTTSSAITRDNTTTINGTLALTNQLTGTTSATVNGTLQLNFGGSTPTSPKYTSSSTLQYNTGGNYQRYNEWNKSSGIIGDEPGYPNNVQISNNTTLNYNNLGAAKLDGSLTIDSGSMLDQNYSGGSAGLVVGKNVTINGTLKLGGAIGGDITVGGDWTDNGTFIPNSRTVTFNGTATQTVTNSSVFLDGHFVEIFDYLTVAGSGTLKLGADTNIRVIKNNGVSLSSINATSTIDLNGNTFNYNGGGDLNLNSGNRYITNSNATTGYFRVADASVTATNLGTLTLQSNAVFLVINASYNPGASGATIINSSLLMKAAGSISTYPVKYGNGSYLKYSTDGATFNKGLEWSATTSSATDGLPYNVQIMDNTTLNYTSSTGNRYIKNNLIIDSGSNLYMDFGSLSCGGFLNVGSNLTSAGGLTLGYAFGDDLKVGGNITFNTGYFFDAKGRAIYFNKSTGNQVITASSKPTFHYLVFESVDNLVRLAPGTSLDITAPNGGNVIAFNSAANVFDINDGNTLTLGTTGIANVISGSGTFTTGANATPGSMVLLGNGSIGTINFSSNQNLANFTVNRQAGTIGLTLGTDLKVSNNLTLTNGIVDLGANLLTLGSSTAAGTLTGGSANSYIIADRSATAPGVGGKFKIFSPTVKSYFFPIGDSTASPNGTQYSPATITLTAATLTSSSYLQLNVEDDKEPNNAATVDYISRYWNLNGTSVTNATFNFTGTYLPVDVVGTETNSFSGRYTTSNGWTEGAALGSNTISLTGLLTSDAAINTTVDFNHFSGGAPLSLAEIEIRQAGTIYANGTTFDFGNVTVGTNLNKTFRIFNRGLELLTLGASTLSGAEYLLFSNYTSPVPKASNSTNYSDFTIRFTPSALGTFTGSISIPNNDVSGSENPYIINFTGVGVASNSTDIITANSEQTSISSTVNTVPITDNAKGVEVWKFTIREGGAAGDADNLPSILTNLNIAKSASSSISDWRDAIYSIALFDGNSTTPFATGNVSSATQIQFTGLNLSIADNTSKTISVRLSLKCPLGAGAVDGDDFVFSISNANATFSNTGSGSAAFLAAVSTDAKNVIDVTATKLAFTTQPINTAVNQSMPTVKVSALDACNNVDRNFGGTVSITSTGSLLSPITPISFTSGVASFTNIVHNAVDTNRTLTATSGSFSVVSNTFDIVASSNFERGDFMVVGVNSNIVTCSGTNPAYSAASSYTSGADEISFFSFKNIYNGDVFYITDNGYERSTASEWGDTEGVYKITRTGTTIAAGTVINMWLYDSNPFVTFTSPDNGWTVTKEPGFAGSVVLNKDGDQLYFMQGGSWSNPSGTNDAVYTPGAVLFAFNTYNSWESIGNSTQKSGLYPGMRCFSVLPNAATDYLEYTGSVTPATRRDWIERINNPNNWTDRFSCAGYTRMHVDQTYTILSGTTVNGLWRGSTDNNWFDCSNWDNLNVPDQSTNVSIPATANNDVLISAVAVDSDLYGYIAKSNNIDINKKLTIEGSSNNKLEVYGNLTLNTGGTIDMDDGNTATQDGQIYLYNGNWTNTAGEANFLQGQSTVHLLGSSPQIINGNNHNNVEKFGNLVLGNNFDTAVSNDLYMDGTLTINANKTLTVNNSGNYVEVVGNVTNNGTLTVENDGNFIQRDGTYTGSNITVKRNANLKRLDYNYWGSPVSSQNLKSFSTGTLNTRFYTYNEADDLFYWIDPVANSFQRGLGYAIRASNYAPSTPALFNGTFLGQPNNGTFTVPIAYSGADHGFNLISNPYPSNINFDDLYNANSGLIYQTAYFWTNVNANPEMQGNQYPKTGSINNYAVYSGLGGVAAPYGFDPSRPATSTPNATIKVGQGFIVKAQTSGNLSFSNAIRGHDNYGSFFNRQSSINQKDRIWLELKTPLNFVNPILIGYANGASNGFEQNYDAPLLVAGADSFYSILDNQKLVIQGRAYPPKDDDIIPLGATFYESGKHTISISKKDGAFISGKAIYLHDKLLGIYADLQKEPYVFEAQQGESKDRFEITYTGRSLAAYDIKTKGLVIYQSNSQVFIEANEAFKEVKVYDFSGKLIRTIKSGKKQLVIEKNQLMNGVNIFSVIFAKDIVNKKLISQ